MAKSADVLVAGATGRVVDDVRRIYLIEYRDTWKAFIADVRLGPIGSISQALERTRFLAAPDTPLLPLLRAMSRETTLLAGQGAAGQRAARWPQTRGQGPAKPLDPKPATKGAPGERIESIVDDRFIGLRRLVPPRGAARRRSTTPCALVGEVQVMLNAADAAIKGGGAPQPSPVPNKVKAEASGCRSRRAR